MPNGDQNKPARLPGAAPAALRQFVSCATDRVELDLSQMGWVPKPAGMDGLPAPTVAVADGWTARTATITVGYGYLRIELPATIVDGQLNIDTSSLDIGGVGAEVDKWVDAFNRTLRENGKQLDSFDMRNGKAAITKQAIPAAAPAGGAAVAPVTTPSTGTAPAAPPSRRPGGCLGWLIGAVVAVAVAVGITLAVTGDDAGDDAITTGQEGEEAPASTSSTTTTSTEPPPAPTTTVQVGQVAPPSEPETRVCGVAPASLPDLDASGEFSVDTFFDVFTEVSISGQPGCVPGPGSYGNDGCDPLFLPCATSPSPPFFVPGGNPGIDHTRSVPDAVTGDEGRSLAEFAQYVRLFLGDEDADAILQIASDCGGNVLTGEVPVMNGAVNVVGQPLFNFGNCTVIDATVMVDGSTPEETFARELAATLGLGYVVGPDEPDPGLPQNLDSYVASNPAFDVPDDWADASRTLTQSVAVAPFDDDCFWFFPPENFDVLVKMLDGCGDQNNFWVFAAGTTDVETTLTVDDSVVVGHGAAFVNPPADPDDPAGFGPFLSDAVLPCGPGDVAHTVCPPGGPDLDATSFVTVSAATLDTIPIDPDGTNRSHTIDFGPSGGPAYEVAQTADGWGISSSAGDTRARAVFRDNSITLLAPQDELPPGPLDYEFGTTVEGVTSMQPIVPVTGFIEVAVGGEETIVPEPPSPVEPIEEFYANLSASISTGDIQFALDRLDPTVIEAYPTECPAALETFVDPDFLVVPGEVGQPAQWVWELPDGRSFDVPDAIPVTITVSGRGQTGTAGEAHVTVIEGEYHWFTFCQQSP